MESFTPLMPSEMNTVETGVVSAGATGPWKSDQSCPAATGLSAMLPSSSNRPSLWTALAAIGVRAIPATSAVATSTIVSRRRLRVGALIATVVPTPRSEAAVPHGVPHGLLIRLYPSPEGTQCLKRG